MQRITIDLDSRTTRLLARRASRSGSTLEDELRRLVRRSLDARGPVEVVPGDDLLLGFERFRESSGGISLHDLRRLRERATDDEADATLAAPDREAP